jgi:hypothetical protein
MLRYLPAIASRSGEAGGLRARSSIYYDIALKCTALRHEASDFIILRSSSLPMKASDSCKIQVICRRRDFPIYS